MIESDPTAKAIYRAMSGQTQDPGAALKALATVVAFVSVYADDGNDPRPMDVFGAQLARDLLSFQKDIK